MAALLCAFVLLLFNFWLFYPGLVTIDSIRQYEQALSGRFTDVHPPLMAAVWGVLYPIWPGARPMLALNLLLYWGSFAALAIYCFLSTGRRWGLFAVFAGLFPLLLSFSGVIWKDVTLAASWGLSCGLLLLSSRFPCKRRVFWTLWSASAALLIFGSAVRHNAPPAAIVLAVALVQPLRVGRPTRLLTFAAIAATAASAVPLSVLALDATEMGAASNLIRWDLTGMSYFSGRDLQASPPQMLSPGALECYSPRVNFCPRRHFESPREGFRKWREAIGTEPLAYLKHRSLVLGMLLRVGCKRCNPYIWERGSKHNPPGLDYQPNRIRMFLGYVVQRLGKTPLGRPYVWLIASLGFAMMLWRRPAVAQSPILSLIALSGAVYALTYSVVTVTDEFRYIYWVIYSVVVVGTVWLFSMSAGWRDLLAWVVAPVLIAIAGDTIVQFAWATDEIAPSMAAIY